MLVPSTLLRRARRSCMSGCARPPFAPPKANSGRLFAMAKQRRKLLLVDGYNVLRSGSRYRDMRNPGPNRLRYRFVQSRSRSALTMW